MSDPAEFLVRIDVGDAESLAFDSPGMLISWVRDEASRWSVFSDGGTYVESDPVADLGDRGSVEHAADWLKYSERADNIALAVDVDQTASATDLADEVSRRIVAHDLLYSRGPIGSSALSLYDSDEAAARVLIALATGRDISRVIHPHGIRRLWRSLPRIMHQVGASRVQGELDQGLQALDLNLAGAKSKEESLGSVLEKAKESAAAAERNSAERLDQQLLALGGKADGFLGRVQEEWDALRTTYDKKLALRAPRNYWDARRRVHRVGATVWGALAAIFAMTIGFVMVPSASDMLTAKLATILLAGAEKLTLGVVPFLPEIFRIAVVGFLCLWALRFMVRQSAEHLGRLQEASIRVTMVETFLALSNPNEDSRVLVDEADRAVIVQALFRPGLGEGIDDAPPVHWVEDVFRRLRKPAEK